MYNKQRCFGSQSKQPPTLWSVDSENRYFIQDVHLMKLNGATNVRHHFLILSSIIVNRMVEDRVDNLLSKNSVEIKVDRSPSWFIYCAS